MPDDVSILCSIGAIPGAACRHIAHIYAALNDSLSSGVLSGQSYLRRVTFGRCLLTPHTHTLPTQLLPVLIVPIEWHYGSYIRQQYQNCAQKESQHCLLFKRTYANKHSIGSTHLLVVVFHIKSRHILVQHATLRSSLTGCHSRCRSFMSISDRMKRQFL